VIGALVKKEKNDENCAYKHAPAALMPVPYPLKHYKMGLDLQPAMGNLVAGIIRDPKNTIHPVIDDFT
jgi:hypothetical protein